MKSRKQQLEAALLCDALGADDGIDLRGRKKTSQHSKRTFHQDQLTRQVERALSLAFSTSADPILQILAIVAVSGIGNSFQVVVAPLNNEACLARPDIETALYRASGRLRTMVGEAITRKRVPELIFSVYRGMEMDHV